MPDKEVIEYVEIPELWKKSPVVGLMHENSRWYVERGNLVDLLCWTIELNRHYPGNLVPLSMVPDLVRVSRNSVYRRAVSGGLTVFSFIVTEPQRTFLGKTVERDTRNKHDFAVLSECEAWLGIILNRALKSGRSGSFDSFNREFEKAEKRHSKDLG